MWYAQANLNNLLLSVVYLLVAGLQQRVWGARLAARLTVRCPGIMRCRHTCIWRLGRRVTVQAWLQVPCPWLCWQPETIHDKWSLSARSVRVVDDIRLVSGNQLAQSSVDEAERRALQHRLAW